MEATDTIESALEKIIAPAQEETGETNQVEEETTVTPEADEVELEAVEETEELDELEVSEEDIEDAQRFLGRLERAIEAGNEARIAVNVVDLRHKIKGTRISVSLTADEQAHAEEVAQTLMAVFMEYPTLSIPRERTLETVLEKVVAEIKRYKKEAQG